MTARPAFTSRLAPDIVRYLTVKQALGREYDGVRRVLAHVDHFVTARGDDLTPNLRRVVSHAPASRVGYTPRPHAGRAKFLPVHTPPCAGGFCPG